MATRYQNTLAILALLAVINHSASQCTNGVSRIRLTASEEGFIQHPYNNANNYPTNTKCSWFLEGDGNTSFIQLKFSYYGIECLWDRLYVYHGDSLYGDMYASITGSMNIVDEGDKPTPVPLYHDDGSGSGNGSGDGYATPIINELSVTVPGSSVLLYFFSDASAAGKGFNVSYWINSCINDCSGNGVCNYTTGECNCDSMWTGQYCQYRACLNDCSNNGHCDSAHERCVCDDGYTGDDCSVMKGSPHWSVITGSDLIERAGHTSVKWGNYVWVYGGYRYSNRADDDDSGSGFIDTSSQDLVRYNMATGEWEEVTIQSMAVPKTRHSHSAIVYNNSMYVYGGALVENESILNELWRFDFITLQWTWLNPPSTDNSTTNTSSDVNSEPTLSPQVQSLVVSTDNDDHTHSYLPLPTKYHTATLVNNTMIVLFGYSVFAGTVTNYVQTYDLVSMTWSLSIPHYSDGEAVTGRMGHASTYIPSLNTILVHGGSTDKHHHSLISYSVSTNTWDMLADSPVPMMFHSSVSVRDSLVVVFGGYSKENCVNSEVFVYNIACNEWTNTSTHDGAILTSLHRFGHSSFSPDDDTSSIYTIGGYTGAFFSSDVLVYHLWNCSLLDDEDSCMNESVCMWNENQCMGVSLPVPDNAILSCDYAPCSIYYGCSSCTSSNCQWNSTIGTCESGYHGDDVITSVDQCMDALNDNTCDGYTDCVHCQTNSSCVWNISICVENDDNDDSLPSLTSCDVSPTSCLQYTSCSECGNHGNKCLWCDSTHMCVDTSVYPESFLYGQCLAWYGHGSGCPSETCSDYNTCDGCYGDLKCGWCRDPSDTGLGTCTEGGYLSPSLDSSCADNTHWFYDQCPLCNCNGHSYCVNQTICEDCQNMTTGDHCEKCVSGFYGSPLNGKTCTECNCNGYNPVCDSVNGSCMCLDVGVTGTNCTICDSGSSYIYYGDAENFCRYEMSVGFIYTFSVTEDRQKQAFYTTVPKNGNRLNIKFDITRNLFNAELSVQFFIGRVSEDYLLLLNLTDPIKVSGTGQFSRSFRPFSSDQNYTEFFTFARESLQIESNFSELLYNSYPNDYTDNMWDGDLGLVIYVRNHSTSLQYKITIDQNDYIFLAYFFVTFVVCFALLLGVFLLGWFIKRKLEIRAIIRAHHVEMQRRVRRPFARVKAMVEKTPDLHAKQSASYVSVETCRDNKAAVLSLLIRLPGDRQRGVPTVNRTGIGFGSTLVRMNQSSTKSRDRRTRLSRNRHSTSILIDEHST